MLRRVTSIVAVVLVANAAALALVARNNRGAPDASLVLTERELRVTNRGSDTTGMTLSLQWNRNAVRSWFDTAKLASIGFDCSVPAGAPEAADRYSSPGALPRSAYVVLEYARSDVAAGGTEAPSGLNPIDVGRDPVSLRAQYPDRHRYLITAGSVRATFTPATASQPAALHGLVLWIEPTDIYVPQAMQQTIVAAMAGKSQSPRYEVTVEYGSAWLPRIVSVRAY